MPFGRLVSVVSFRKLNDIIIIIIIIVTFSFGKLYLTVKLFNNGILFL